MLSKSNVKLMCHLVVELLPCFDSFCEFIKEFTEYNEQTYGYFLSYRRLLFFFISRKFCSLEQKHLYVCVVDNRADDEIKKNIPS